MDRFILQFQSLTEWQGLSRFLYMWHPYWLISVKVIDSSISRSVESDEVPELLEAGYSLSPETEEWEIVTRVSVDINGTFLLKSFFVIGWLLSGCFVALPSQAAPVYYGVLHFFMRAQMCDSVVLTCNDLSVQIFEKCVRSFVFNMHAFVGA